MNCTQTMHGFHLRLTRVLVVAATVAVALLGSAAAGAGSAAAQTPEGAPATAPLRPEIAPGQLGWLRLRVMASAGDTITVSERLDGHGQIQVARFILTGPAGGRAHLASWRCDRRSRHFTVVAEGAAHPPQQVALDVVTPSCVDRVQLRVATRRPTARRPLTLALRDRWRTGQLPLRLCVKGPADAAARCRAIGLSTATPSRAVSVDVPQGGRYRITLRGPRGVGAARTVLVAPRTDGVRLLATGDSEIQILDGLIAERLRPSGGRVTSDAHIGTGISKLFQLNWLQHALTSARSVQPDVTVVFLGANDGYAVGAAACCGDDWSRAYADRAARMMRAYVRGGAGRVFWYLLPRPRPAGYARVFDAVNRALRLAAPRVPGVRLVDLGPVVTPGGDFHQTVTYQDRTVNVRQPDGIHLSVGGDRIALDLLVAAMRADGVL